MKDYIVRVISKQANIRGLACVTTNLVNKACQRHGTSPTASAALGRAMTGGLLLGALLEPDQRVALKFEGNGPLKKIIVEADGIGNVKGFVGEAKIDLPLKNGKFDVASAIGRAGFLTVSKDLGLKEPYKGIVQLYTSEIASDIAFYLTESEQIPSAVGLGVFVDPDTKVSAAGGFLIQSMPPSNEKTIDTLIAQIEKMPPVTDLLRSGNIPEGLLEHIFADIPFKILEKKNLYFKCSCSRARIEQALITLGKDELLHIIKNEEHTEISCEFCCKKYSFTKKDFMRLIEEMR
jgi:molecular chaperone Hsp33